MEWKKREKSFKDDKKEMKMTFYMNFTNPIEDKAKGNCQKKHLESGSQISS